MSMTDPFSGNLTSIRLDFNITNLQHAMRGNWLQITEMNVQSQLNERKLYWHKTWLYINSFL